MISITLILNNERDFSIPCSRKILSKIPECKTDLYDQLISTHRYYVQSNVKESTFEAFLNYFKNDEVPKFDVDNILEYQDLNEEFGILNVFLASKLDPLLNLQRLTDQKNATNKESIENDVSLHFEHYLEKYPEELSKIQFNALYNIFFKSANNLQNHDQAYNFIIKYAEKVNNKFYCLLPILDANKMKENQRDCCIKQNEHFGFCPLNCNSYILQLEDKVKELESNENSEKIQQIKINENENLSEEEILNHEIITIEFNGNENNRLNGIVNYLTNVCKEKGIKITDIIKVDSNSIQRHNGCKTHEPENVIIYDYECNYISQNNLNSFIYFNFNKLRIKLNSYSIKSSEIVYHKLRNWQIHGSNDFKTWELLDNREKDTSLNPNGASNTFDFNSKKGNEAYKYIKLSTTGIDNSNEFYIVIESIEFFGTIYGKI